MEGSEKERGRVEYLVRKFFAACGLAYRRSRKGTLPGWVAEIVDGAGGAGAGSGGGGEGAPLALMGYTGDFGMVVSRWEIGDGNPIGESLGWAALLRVRALREFWTLEMRENHRVEMEKLLARTWVVDPTPVPPQGVIPGLEIQAWEEAPRETGDGWGLAIYLPDSDGAGGGEVVWGPDVGWDTWRSTLERAGKGFGAGKVATVQALPGRPEEAVRVL